MDVEMFLFQTSHPVDAHPVEYLNFIPTSPRINLKINGVKTFSITAADRFLLIMLNNNYASSEQHIKHPLVAAVIRYIRGDERAHEDIVTCISTECRCTVTVDYLIVSGTGQSNRSR